VDVVAVLGQDRERVREATMKPIISMTTIPSRLPHIEPTVRSLERQGLPLYVWIQERNYFTGEAFDGCVPEFLRGDRVHVEMVEARGPITKVLPALELGAGRQFQGRRYADSLLIAGPHSVTTVDIITSNWGVLRHASHFEPSIFEEWQTWPLNDDFVMALHMRRRGIGRLVIPLDGCDVHAFDTARVDSLWSINVDKNDEGLEVLGWWSE